MTPANSAHGAISRSGIGAGIAAGRAVALAWDMRLGSSRATAHLKNCSDEVFAVVVPGVKTTGTGRRFRGVETLGTARSRGSVAHDTSRCAGKVRGAPIN